MTPHALRMLVLACALIVVAAPTTRAQQNTTSSQPQLSKTYQDCVHGMYPDSGPANVCLDDELKRHNARLSKLYHQRLAQLASDSPAAEAFRSEHQQWIKSRGESCNARLHPTADWRPTKSDFTRCFIAADDSRSAALENLIRGGAASASAGADAGGPQVPFQMWGKWTVSKILPVKTISCWDQKQADALLGTELEYSANSFRWKDTLTKDATAKAETVTDQKFTEDHSGSGSFVNFKQLGIDADSATLITFAHPDAEITGGTTEIPGDTVLVVDPTHIVISACNMYFVAVKNP